MEDNKKLSAEQVSQYQATPMATNDNYQYTSSYRYPYYFDAVINEAMNRYGLSETDIMNRGYKIYTSLNQNYQNEMQDDFDAVWLIVADEAKRIARVAERDGLDAEMITRIIDSQLSDEEKSLLASDIIENNSTVDHLKDAVNVLLDKYKLGT